MDGVNPWKLVAAVAAGCISGGLLTHSLSKVYTKNNNGVLKEPQRWIRVGTVKKLIAYPIKSCAGVEIAEGIATPLGLKGSAL